MQAIVLHGPNDLRYHADWATPTPPPGYVLLRMTYTSICQTDIELWHRGMFRNPNTPRILGHEAAGVVEQLGEGVDAESIAVGDRVAVENVLTCGRCFFCRKGTAQLCENGRNFGFSDHGGLGEYAVWPASQCIKLPENMTNEEAPLSEPTSVAVHAVRNSRAQVGDTAVVIGCGVVGLVTLQVLRAAGASVIAIDPRAQSLELASELGAIETLNPSDVDPAELLPGLTNGHGPDLVFDAAGAPGTALDAIRWTRRGGTAVIVGIDRKDETVNLGRILMGEKTVVSSAATNTGEYQKAVDLIASGAVNVKPLISAKVSLERGIPDGFERMLKPEKDVFRILVGNG